MTKKLLNLLALMFTLVLTFTLVSCGDTEEVTEEEWNKFFSLDGYDSFTIKYEEQRGVGDRLKKASGTFKYTTTDTGCAFTDTYKDFSDTKSEKMNSLVLAPFGTKFFEEVLEYMPSFYENDGAILFSNFTYNEETMAYETTETIDDPELSIKLCVYFKSGMLDKITLSCDDKTDDKDYTYESTLIFSDWNKTELK